MALYEFRFVGDNESFATKEMDKEPVAGEAVMVDGITYPVEGLDPTRWGQPVIVYVYDPEAP